MSGEDRADSPAVDNRTSGLLRQQGRQLPDAAPQPDHLETGRLRRFGKRLRGTLPQHVERVDVVHDGDVMTPGGERLCEPLNGDAIAPEVVRRVEGGEKTESQ